MQMWMIWVIAAILFAIIEIYTPSFFIIWFSAGSLCATLTSLVTDNIIVQFSVFILVSVLLILLTKKFADKCTKKSKNYKTNSDKLINEIGVVTETIKPLENTGRIKVNGESWKALSKEIIEKDSKVKIISIEGVTLYVEKCE